MVSNSPLMLRYAARSHVGLVRAKNDDSGYVGRYLAVVADGMGGHAGGDVASASTVLDLIHLDRGDYKGDAGTQLADEIQTANSLLSELVHVNPKLAGMGTTVTSLLLDGNRLAYAHIGDSRAYRLKNGVFEQVSSDHTFVQRMIDEGRMTEAEAEVHPHKNVLMRVLGDVDASPELDLKYFEAEVGERWLLCSDGLNFVRPKMVEDVVRNSKDLSSAADTLIELTLAAGSPDNVTVVMFDVVEPYQGDEDAGTLSLPVVSHDAELAESLNQKAARDALASDNAEVGDAEVGDAAELGDEIAADGDADKIADREESAQEAANDSAGESEKLHDESAAESSSAEGTTSSHPAESSDSANSEEESTENLDARIRAAVVLRELAQRPHQIVGAAVTANAEGKIPLLANHPSTKRAAQVLTHKPSPPVVLAEESEESLPRWPYRKFILWAVAAIAVVAVVVGSWLAYSWTQTQYYVGVANGNVAIYKGVSQGVGPISLSHVERETSVSVAGLPQYSQQLVNATMPAASLSSAEQIISDLQLGTGVSTPPCELPPTATPSAPTGSSTASGSASKSASPSATTSAKPTQTATKAPATMALAKPTASATATAKATSSPTSDATAQFTPTCIPGGGK